MPILTERQDKEGVRLWRIALTSTSDKLPAMSDNAYQTTLKSYITYDLPSVESLVRYFHSAEGFKFRATWINTVKAVNYRTWSGITLANATAY